MIFMSCFFFFFFGTATLHFSLFFLLLFLYIFFLYLRVLLLCYFNTNQIMQQAGKKCRHASPIFFFVVFVVLNAVFEMLALLFHCEI